MGSIRINEDQEWMNTESIWDQLSIRINKASDQASIVPIRVQNGMNK